MLSILFLSSLLVVQGISLPRQDSSTFPSSQGGPSTYIACVTDTKIPSLTQSTAVSAGSREECSSSCSSSTEWDLAFFRQDTSECYCSPSSDAPTSDEIVYAVDESGNCRSQDDASVEYLHSEYTFSTCLIPTLSPPSSNFTSSNPIECLSNCPDTTETISIRPEYNGGSDTFEYECGCYDQGVDIGGGQKIDCGFGIDSVYVKA